MIFWCLSSRLVPRLMLYYFGALFVCLFIYLVVVVVFCLVYIILCSVVLFGGKEKLERLYKFVLLIKQI